jgi:hypothetical protein
MIERLLLAEAFVQPTLLYPVKKAVGTKEMGDAVLQELGTAFS